MNSFVFVVHVLTFPDCCDKNEVRITEVSVDVSAAGLLASGLPLDSTVRATSCLGHRVPLVIVEDVPRSVSEAKTKRMIDRSCKKLLREEQPGRIKTIIRSQHFF